LPVLAAKSSGDIFPTLDCIKFDLRGCFSDSEQAVFYYRQPDKPAQFASQKGSLIIASFSFSPGMQRYRYQYLDRQRVALPVIPQQPSQRAS